MKQRKICGYDVNGWRDFAARNWSVGSDGEADFSQGAETTGGSPLPDLIATGTEEEPIWIGGAQARMAPHGRGEGWGEVGKRWRRRSLRDVIDQDAAEDVTPALRDLVAGARTTVLSLSDIPHTTEKRQEALLAALRGTKARQSLLVWRPVLAVLHGIENNLVSVGQTVGVVTHEADGLAIQNLKIRGESTSGGTLLAPERRRGGRHIASAFGYRPLADQARQTILALGQHRRSTHLETADAIGALTFGLPTKPELHLDDWRRWELITPPDKMAPPTSDLRPENFAELADCDVVLLETLSEGELRTELTQAVAAAAGQDPILLPVQAVALGALEAARRHDIGAPVYLDFLPGIATIVATAEGAASYDLISKDEVLPAGKVYRSPLPATFGLRDGQDKLHLYLRKETALWPREAVVNFDAIAPKGAEVKLYVEQTPAAGRARIVIDAPALGRQFPVDWEAATEIEKPWEEIVETQSGPKPNVPARLVLPCGMNTWKEQRRNRGLEAALRDFSSTRPDWDALATALSARVQGEYCVSSDGELPEALAPATRDLLQKASDSALVATRNMQKGRIVANTGPLKVLTWQFRRAPEEIADLLLDEIERKRRDEPALFADVFAQWVLIFQGLGRTINTWPQEERALRLLFDIDVSTWSWRLETACAAFLLTRSDTAPLLLDRDWVESLCQRALQEIDAEIGGEYTKFGYTPLLILGLLRWRKKEPYTLVVGSDGLADALLEGIERVQADLPRLANQTGPKAEKLRRKAEKLTPALEGLVEELRGEGGNSNLPIQIFALT